MTERDTQTFLDVEFVVIDYEAGAALARRARPAATSPALYDWGDDAGLTLDEARALLAGLLRCPLKDCRIVAQAGRAYLLEYEPLGKIDPDIVLCAWPSARPINRLICELQEARALNWGNWGEFWQGMNRYVEDLESLLKGATITALERSFVLRWAYRIRDTGAALVDARRRDYANYWG